MSEPGQRLLSAKTIFLWLIHLAVIVLLVASPVPGINESHYLPKAKHAMDANFAPGDLFLDSHNSHFVSTYFAGAWTRVFSLSTSAWLLRLLAWSCFAASWCHLWHSLRCATWLSPFGLAAWYLATTHGHWAGEWALGGFEGKSMAYPCVLMALSMMLRDQWKFAWLWFAFAIVWHPLVGLWAGLSGGLVWICSAHEVEQRWKAQLPWLASAAGLSLIGILPALSGIGGADRDGQLVASQIHVYYRLPHHLSPLGFDPSRHQAAFWTGLALLIVTVSWLAFSRIRGKVESQGENAGPRGARLLYVAWWALLFAFVGFLIDTFLSNAELPSFRPALGSKLLRYYWFRWADIAVPLGWTSCFWCLSDALIRDATIGPREKANDSSEELSTSRLLGVAMLVLGLVATAWTSTNWLSQSSTLPAADQFLVRPLPTPNNVASRRTPEERYMDWRAACAWIRTNTPEDSLWLTPKFQQSFKWYAERAEVVCWKDVPQDNRSVLEWFKRIQATEPPRTPSGALRNWTRDELLRLSREYGFQWILVDQRFEPIGTEPLLLELAYPTGGIGNSSFYVYRIPTIMMRDKATTQ